MENKFEVGRSPEKKEGYPADFIAKVKAELPGKDSLHKALDEGSGFVGRHLEHFRRFSMKPEEIVKSFEDGNQNAVLEAAKKAVRLNNLYCEWGELFRRQEFKP